MHYLARVRNRFDLTKALVILALCVTGIFLLAFYLPLPRPQISVASEIYDAEGRMITTFYTENRRPVALPEMPPFLRQAFLAVEDHRFYQHHGINPGRILKAAWYDLVHHSLAQGASTITQQLAKNAYLSGERTWLRKIKELFLTVKLELHFSKDQILETYLNQICFGHGAYGVKTAAATYFHKNLSDLNQAEMALLAGLPKGPAYYSPYTHPEAARRRIGEVLERMRVCGFITPQQFQSYRRMPLSLPGIRTPSRPAPYFLELVQNEVEAIFPKEPGLIYRAGLQIETGLDSQIQGAAEKAMRRGLPRLFKDRNGLPQPQGALIAIDPANGEIKAFMGGTDFAKSQFNRGTQAKRQPGSAFKPILYAAALGEGFTLATLIDRAPASYFLGTQVYRPLDHDQEDLAGMISLRDALAGSSNVVAVKLLNQLGLEPVLSLAAKLGIASRLPARLSLALGSGEVTPLEMTAAYLPFANGGFKVTPHAIRRIRDSQGRLLYEAPGTSVRVLDPGVAFLVTQALTGVFKAGGTAANIGSLPDQPVAGKTGTTEANRDAWFIGYTPDLLAGVYVGCDRNERRLPGNANLVAAPIWARFIRAALAGRPVRDFTVPGSVSRVAVCQESGAKATSFCPVKLEYFLKGTEPTQYCEKHRFIDLEICRRSGLLAGPDCRSREIRRFSLGEQPTAVCQVCKKPIYFLEWLHRMFERSR